MLVNDVDGPLSEHGGRVVALSVPQNLGTVVAAVLLAVEPEVVGAAALVAEIVLACGCE